VPIFKLEEFPMPIRMAQPSLLLNSYQFTDVFGGCGMFMDTTWNCPKSTRPQDIVGWIHTAYARTPNKKLHNVVLNFHGPGEDNPLKDSSAVIIGEARPESGFGTTHFREAIYITLNLSNVGVFSALKGTNPGTIWFHGCAVARTMKGKYLCQRIAECCGWRVVAAEDDQEEWVAIINWLTFPRGTIDDYEGRVYLWDGKGKVGPFSPNGGYWD
jgi:hypothetical protein